MGVVKHECGHSCLRTLKLAVSPEVINGINWLLVRWYKFRKARSYFNNVWRVLIDHGTLKSGVSDKWFDELSRLVKLFSYVDIDGIIGGPVQLYLAGFFRKSSLWAKTTKIEFFLYLDFWLETQLNENWYCYLFYCTNPISVEILVLEL